MYSPPIRWISEDQYIFLDSNRTNKPVLHTRRKPSNLFSGKSSVQLTSSSTFTRKCQTKHCRQQGTSHSSSRKEAWKSNKSELCFTTEEASRLSKNYLDLSGINDLLHVRIRHQAKSTLTKQETKYGGRKRIKQRWKQALQR
jgi:hypothetical protein